MISDFSSVEKAVQCAMQMEVDGKEYYMKTGSQCRSEVGKKLMAALADAEDVHRKKFESIFEAIRSKKAWPAVKLPQGKAIKTIFAEALAGEKAEPANPSTELDAVDKAIRMEIESYDYYVGRSKQAAAGPEKEFYEAVAGEEHEHQMTLLDYKEFLADPAAWFVRTEHPTFD